MHTRRIISMLLLTSLLAACGADVPASGPNTPGQNGPITTDIISGKWTGRLDNLINFTADLKLATQVTGTVTYLDKTYDVTGTWSADTGKLTFSYQHANGFVQVQGTANQSGFSGTYTMGSDPDEGQIVMTRTTPGTSNPGDTQATPYTMKGMVRNAAGQPISGVDVWADNTLYYNMNVLNRTDAQGRYSIQLPRDQLGTWQAGGVFKTVYNGEAYELGLKVDNDSAFTADVGAVRNFTLLVSGPRGDGYWGGNVWGYGAYKNGNFSLKDVEVTLTPDGPIIDGSAGQVLTRRFDGNFVVDVPIGRYKVTARHVPSGGTPRNMIVKNREEDTFSDSTVVMFERVPQYGTIAEFELSLPPQP